MELLTEEIRAKLPPLYSTERERDPMVWLKFFIPVGNWTWYVIEFDGDDLFFGYVEGFENELGYFRLSELQGVHVELGLGVDRDVFFQPTRLSELTGRPK